MGLAQREILSFDKIRTAMDEKAFRKRGDELLYSEKIVRTEIGYDMSTRFVQEEFRAQQERLRDLAVVVYNNFYNFFADTAGSIPFCITENNSGMITYASARETEGLPCSILCKKNSYLIHDLNEGRQLLIHVRDNSVPPENEDDFGKIISYPIFNTDKKMIAVLMFGSYEGCQPFDEITQMKIDYCCRYIQEQYLHLSWQKRQLQEVIDAIPEGVVVLGPEQRVAFANQYLLDYIGISQDELPRISLFDEDGTGISKLSPYALESFIIKSGESSVRCGIISSKRFQIDGSPRLLLTLSMSRCTPARVAPSSSELSAMDRIICRSPQMKKLKLLAAKVAPQSATVLIQGESGTGKELFAKAIHEASGRSGPMLSINSATCNKDLLESELFGYEEGAYTGARRGGRKGLFELADNGTLLLDEISEMPLPMQASLLRVLNDKVVSPLGSNKARKVNTRIIAATNKNLLKMVEEQTFREDLYYRLSVVRLDIPPLRARAEDIPCLVHSLRTELCQEHGVAMIPVTDEAVGVLQQMQWKGNVRELKNLLEFILLTNEDKAITAGAVLEAMGSSAPPGGWAELTLTKKEDDAERILKALEMFDNNKTRAAAFLGVSRKTLYKKMKLHEIER